MHLPITEIAKTVRRVTVKNSPAILTAVAVTGVVSTSVLTAKASFQASDAIRKAEYSRLAADDYKTDFKEKFQLTWQLYIPAVATGAATIACVIGANTVSTRRNAALMSAYSLTETALKEYKEKVVEVIGENKEQKLRDEIAQDRVTANPVTSNQVIFTGNGEVLCYESMTGRYFNSDHETLRKAENDINHKMMSEMYASYNEFCDIIGLPGTGHGSTIGWNNERRLELQFSSVLSEENKPCLSIGYRNLPSPDFDDLH